MIQSWIWVIFQLQLFCRNIMRLLKLGKNGWIYLLNMTLLVISYFTVRIMPLPLVLNLYASTKDGSMVEGSSYGSTICALQTFLIIPNQCKLGVVVFYTLQMYWFFNITRNWIQAITSKVRYAFSSYEYDIGFDLKRDSRDSNVNRMTKKSSWLSNFIVQFYSDDYYPSKTWLYFVWLKEY